MVKILLFVMSFAIFLVLNEFLEVGKSFVGVGGSITRPYK